MSHNINCCAQPRVVSLRNITNDQHICGATLLSPLFAVTAAHCAQRDPLQYTLQINNYCHQSPPKAQVLEIITHQLYDRLSLAHDISLLRINIDSDDVAWLNHTVLPKSSFGLAGECMIYGYGYNDLNTKKTSETLSVAKATLVSLDKCKQILGPVAPEYDHGMLCAVGIEADSCQGDSGGPLICKDSEIQGISSYGLSCGVPGVPAVYTSIGSHLQWIREVTNIR
ncbi:enteropeptidase-like isoform X2 [Achroia grisella]|uniref:enteropeptidase-like isoform X2 n=1 Tax=Achroia grisella TaxID=688607 RepID=UPI0027D310A0|nr:enteropeptidase-like isoform X2 [Achroia grisella]